MVILYFHVGVGVRCQLRVIAARQLEVTRVAVAGKKISRFLMNVRGGLRLLQWRRCRDPSLRLLGDPVGELRSPPYDAMYSRHTGGAAQKY